MITTHPTVREVMTTDLVTAFEETPFKQLVRLIREHAVSAIPIIDDDGLLVGIVTESDLLVKEQHAGGELPHPNRTFELDRVDAIVARDLMTWPVLTIKATASIAEAAHTMQEFGVRHLVVTGGRGRPLGIVSRSDLLGVYLRPDSEIQAQVAFGVADEMLSIDPAAIHVEVLEGVVTLSGELPDGATAQLLVSVVERLPGVVAVVDELRTRPRHGGGWPYEPPPDVDSENDRPARPLASVKRR